MVTRHDYVCIPVAMNSDGRLTVQRLGEGEQDFDYEHGHQNFAGDCVYATQCHFVRALMDGLPFETSGEDYLRTLAVQEAVYESAASGTPVVGLTQR